VLQLAMAVVTCNNFSHVLDLPDHPLTKQSTTKFPAILDSFLTKVDCIRKAEQWVVVGAVVGQRFN